MPGKAVSDRCCTNDDCPLHGRFHEGNIVRHGFFRLKRGPRRRRYRCTDCGKTFSSNNGSPYYRLQGSRRSFDTVATMSVEGVSKASIARIMGIAWNTVARWLRRAAGAARRFNDRMTRGYEVRELQADELRTLIDRKSCATWVFSVIEVWSRLWPSCLLGKRAYRNTRRVIGDTVRRGRYEYPPSITTDGFQYYRPVIRRSSGLPVSTARS